MLRYSFRVRRVQLLALLVAGTHCFGFIVREYDASEETSGQNHGEQRAHKFLLPGD
jgi:hypothetical protein